MLKLTLAGLRMHRNRLLLAAFATLIGTAFFAGTLILSDTLRANTERTVIGNAAKIGVAATTNNQMEQFPPETLHKVASLDGVTKADGHVEGDVTVLGSDGRPSDGQPVGVSVTMRTALLSGTKPTTPDEVVIAEQTAQALNKGIGDTVTILDNRNGDKHEFRISGLMNVSGQGTLALRGGIGFTTPAALEITGESEFSALYIKGEHPEALLPKVEQAVGAGPYSLVTGRQFAEESASASGIDPVVLGVGLTMFALVALLVSMFVIYNTFTILVAQRTRELALARCVGASRRQVFASVLTESVIVGLVASIAGVGLGIGAGYAALPVMNAFGAGIPIEVFTVTWLTISLSSIAGLITTVVAAVMPARVATKVAPVAALRTQSEAAGSNISRVRTAVASLTMLAALCCAVGGLTSNAQYYPLVLVAVGGILFFLGIVALGPVLIRALTPIFGFPFRRLFGVPGKLAVANAMRNPKRAATTVLALIIGITLTTGVSVITRSLETSQDIGVGQAIPADYMITPPGQNDSNTIPPSVAEDLRQQGQATNVTQVREAPVTIGGQTAMISATEGAERPGVIKGSIQGLGVREVALRPERAAELGVDVGDTVDLSVGERTVPTKVVAIVSGNITPRMVISKKWFEELFPGRGDASLLVTFPKDSSPERTREIIDAATSSFPLAKIVSTHEAKERLTSTLNQVTTLVSGLLALAVIISLIGIANTMTLSVTERSRESAMLRALGMTQKRLHMMLTTEALIFGIIGGVVGSLLGTGFGLAAARVINDNIVLTVPYSRVLVVIVGAGVASVLAAYFPSRKATRMSILRAMAAE